MIKVALVLPRPFIILVSVVDKKMKGHKKDNISTNLLQLKYSFLQVNLVFDL